jgi:hypothetical protein
MEGQELIWVKKEFADQYKTILDNDEKERVLADYLKQVSEQAREEYQDNLESLEEHAAIYTGLMLKMKQAFGKASEEALSASYAVWEGFSKEKPKLQKNVDDMLAILKPLEQNLNTINESLAKINTWNIEKVSDAISRFTNLTGKSQEMFEFIVKNFDKEAR